jgi:hypothetical protein
MDKMEILLQFEKNMRRSYQRFGGEKFLWY